MKQKYTILADQYNGIHSDYKGRSIEHGARSLMYYDPEHGTSLMYEGMHFEIVEHPRDHINPVPGYYLNPATAGELEEAVKPYIRPNCVLTLLLNGRVGIAVKGERGYYPTGIKLSNYYSLSRQAQEAIIDEVNDSLLGVDVRDAYKIVLQSMRKD